RKHAIRGKYFCDATIEALASERVNDETWEVSQKEALRNCLKHLNQEDKRLVELRYQTEMSIMELSETTGQSANSFYKRLQRIRKELMECIIGRLGFEGV
ncbi:MAG: sigma factor-like helix-turn-helix DNA-binding protein, partial [Planctomycetota bacterium]